MVSDYRPESPRNAEGTATHWVIERCFPDGDPGDYLGKEAPNSLIVDQEMVEGARIFLADVLPAVKSSQIFGCEERVHMPDIHPDANWGTLDAFASTRAGRIVIWDYKHGRRHVEAQENWQMIDYLNGLAYGHSFDLDTPVSIRVVQPYSYSKSGPIRTWDIPRLGDLKPYWDQLAAAAGEAMSDSPELRAGPWCKNCDAIRACPAARKYGHTVLYAGSEKFDLDRMTGDDLATEWKILRDGISVVNDRIQAIEAELEYRLEEGKDPPGSLAVERGAGREKWIAPHQQVVNMARLFGVEAEDKKLKTPRQVRMSVPAPIRKAFAKSAGPMVERGQGSKKLVEKGEIFAAFKNTSPE